MGQRGWIDAFRAHAEVLTLEEQNLRGEFDLVFDKAQDTFCDILDRLPRRFVPDLCIFTSPEYHPFPSGVEESPYPTICWLGDMHLRAEAALSISRFFDLVIVPEAAAEEMLKKAGVSSVLHFPYYAGDPLLYRKLPDAAKETDVCFVGGLDPVVHRRRCKSIERLLASDAGLRVRIEAGVYGEDANRVYNASKIVFNESVRGDLNIRVSEAMLSGSLTLYEDDNPLVRSFFGDREHLVLYNDENLVELVRHYSEADREREEIAVEGHALAVREHTLEARAGQFLAALDHVKPAPGARPITTEPVAVQCAHMAAARVAEGAPDCAARELERAIDAGGATPVLLNDFGVARAAAGDLEGGRESFESALAIDPACAAALLNLALNYRWANRTHEAREAIERLAAAAGHGGSFRGLVAGREGPVSRFHFDREKAIADHPAREGDGFEGRMRPLFLWMAHSELGDLAAQGGSHAAARLHYAKALNILPDCGHTAHRLASVSNSEGKSSAALPMLAKAVESEPFFTDAQVELAETLWALGREAEAADVSRMFLRSNPLLSQSARESLRRMAGPGNDARTAHQSANAGRSADPARGADYAAQVARMMDESMQSWTGLRQVESCGSYYDDYWKQNQPRADVERWVVDQVFGGPEKLKGLKILDVGCGTGALLEMLKESNEVVGLDASETGVEQAGGRGVEVKRCDCSRERFPFDDDTFDIVIFLGTVEHLSDPQFCLEEVRRVLKDGGRMVTSCPNLRLHHVPRPFYPSLFEFDEFNDLLKANGFWIDRIFCQGRILDPESIAEEHLAAEEWVHDCFLAKKTRPDRHVTLGEDFWNRGKMVEARDCFLRAIEVDPCCPEGYYWLARYFLWQTEFFSRSQYYVSLGLPEVFKENALKLYGFSRELGLGDPEKLSRIESDTAGCSPPGDRTGPPALSMPVASTQRTQVASKTKRAPLRILTTLWHEPYMALLAKTGHRFDVIVHKIITWPHGPWWDQTSRPLPDNIEVVGNPFEVVGSGGLGYDLFLAQTVADLSIMAQMRIPKVFLSHGMLRQPLRGIDDDAQLERMREELRPQLQGAVLVFNDERKRQDWGFEGTVIPGAVDPDDYGGWTGDTEKVLRVGNMMAERDFMLGFSVQEKICSGGIPSTIVGYNPAVPSARQAESFDELKSFYVTHRVFLHTTIEQYEAGYNLAMLEAMATGMPVVALHHSRSPIIDCHNGFISGSVDQLRRRVLELLADRELAARLGRNARQTVIESFNIDGFIEAWERVFAQAVSGSGAAKAA